MFNLHSTFAFSDLDFAKNGKKSLFFPIFIIIISWLFFHNQEMIYKNIYTHWSLTDLKQ